MISLHFFNSVFFQYNQQNNQAQIQHGVLLNQPSPCRQQNQQVDFKTIKSNKSFIFNLDYLDVKLRTFSSVQHTCSKQIAVLYSDVYFHYIIPVM